MVRPVIHKTGDIIDHSTNSLFWRTCLSPLSKCISCDGGSEINLLVERLQELIKEVLNELELLSRKNELLAALLERNLDELKCSSFVRRKRELAKWLDSYYERLTDVIYRAIQNDAWCWCTCDHFVSERLSQVFSTVISYSPILERLCERFNNNNEELYEFLTDHRQLLLNSGADKLLSKLMDVLPNHLLRKLLIETRDRNHRTSLFYVSAYDFLFELYKNNDQELYELLSIEDKVGCDMFSGPFPISLPLYINLPKPPKKLPGFPAPTKDKQNETAVGLAGGSNNSAGRAARPAPELIEYTLISSLAAGDKCSGHNLTPQPALVKAERTEMWFFLCRTGKDGDGTTNRLPTTAELNQRVTDVKAVLTTKFPAAMIGRNDGGTSSPTNITQEPNKDLSSFYEEDFLLPSHYYEYRRTTPIEPITCYITPKFPEHVNSSLPPATLARLARMSPGRYLHHVLKEMMLGEREVLMRDKAQRIRTFEWSWPNVLLTLQPARLAANGFYYLGEGAKVQCAFCGFVSQDPHDMEAEHKRYVPTCELVQKKDAENRLTADHQQGLYARGHDDRHSVPITPEDDEINPAEPFSTDYTRKETREASFKITNSSRLKFDIQKALDSGFYYTGSGDRVRCFYCNGELSNWSEEDDPHIEHARWFPFCSYLKYLKGREWIDTTFDNAPSRERNNKYADDVSQRMEKLRRDQFRNGVNSDNVPVVRNSTPRNGFRPRSSELKRKEHMGESSRTRREAGRVQDRDHASSVPARRGLRFPARSPAQSQGGRGVYDIPTGRKAEGYSGQGCRYEPPIARSVSHRIGVHRMNSAAGASTSKLSENESEYQNAVDAKPPRSLTENGDVLVELDELREITDGFYAMQQCLDNSPQLLAYANPNIPEEQPLPPQDDEYEVIRPPDGLIELTGESNAPQQHLPIHLAEPHQDVIDAEQPQLDQNDSF